MTHNVFYIHYTYHEIFEITKLHITHYIRIHVSTFTDWNKCGQLRPAPSSPTPAASMGYDATAPPSLLSQPKLLVMSVVSMAFFLEVCNLRKSLWS